MVQWDDQRLLACAHGKLSHQGDLVVVQQTTPVDSKNTGLYAELTTLQPPTDPQEHLKLLQQTGVDATWVPHSVEHSSLYEDNVLKLVSGRWVCSNQHTLPLSNTIAYSAHILRVRCQIQRGCQH